jgi:uncharacterized protein (TIGR03437 family)
MLSFGQVAFAAEPGVWTVKAPLPTARVHPVVENINGLIYVAGGLNNSSSLNLLEVFDSATNSWSTKAGMPTVRSGAGSGVINGKLYVVGGGSSVTNQFFNVLEVYDPTTNTWATKAPMPTARESMGVGVIDGKLYVVGGDNRSSYFNVLEIYDPTTDTWATGAPMPTVRNGPAVQVIDGKLYVAGGGNNNGYPATLEVYDPVMNTWSGRASMPTARQYPASGVIGGRLYVVGGIGAVGTGSRDHESYDPVTNTWRTEAPAITGRWGAQGTVINETLYVIGGGVSRGAFTPQIANEAFSVRSLRVISSSGAATGTVTLPVELVSRGDENAVGFSLIYNTGVLSSPQVTIGSDATNSTLNLNTSQTGQGRIGIAVALSTGRTFAAGARELVNVTFTITANALPATTLISFGDQPIARQVVDASANTLPATYTSGAVTVTPGYEADVSPRPNGSNNGSVTIADWVQVGRFAAGLDTVPAGSEFQRADCAPRATLGDGRVNIADWVQAGRYAAGVDEVVAAGGPTVPVSSLLAEREFAVMEGEVAALAQPTTRTVRLRDASLLPGQQGTLAIELDALGNENALGFSLSFDPAKLRFVSATLGNGTNGATLNVNSNQAANGRVGFAVALSAGQNVAAGTRQLLVVTFAAQANAAGAVTVTLGDAPVGREIVDAAARNLTANWTAGVVTIARTVANVSAASYSAAAISSEAIVAAFGAGLATVTQAANTLPLPTTLAGTTVRMQDSVGVERLAPLFFVSPAQVNYLVPAGTALGEATVTVTGNDGTVSTGKVRIAVVTPGLFAANANGQGVAAALVLRVKANGQQIYESLARFDASLNRWVAEPIDLGQNSEQLFLILFGTGMRGRASLAGATATIGGTNAEVLYVGAQGDLVGLDQANLRLPRSLAGRGEVNVTLSVDGIATNVVTVSVK